MARVSPAEATEKWKRNTSAATQDVIRGVKAVEQAPGAKAAAASGKWLARVSSAEAKYKQNVGAVSLADWQAATEAGASRIAAGVQAKAGKMERFMADFLPHLDRGRAAIAQMPTNTLEESIAKMATQVRHNAAFRRAR